MSRITIRPYTSAILSNGSSSELLKTTPTGLNTGANSLSFVTWIEPNNTVLSCYADLLAPVMGRRFCLGDSGGTYYYFSDGVNAGNNMTLTAAQYFAAFGVQRRVRVAWVVTSTAVSLYANGVLVKTQVLGTTMASGTYSKLTLLRNGGGTQPITGPTNDAYFVNGAMTAAEVASDYFDAVYPTGMASAWLMNEGTGTNVVDRIGSNTLTASSITWVPIVPTRARTSLTSLQNAVAFDGSTAYGTTPSLTLGAPNKFTCAFDVFVPTTVGASGTMVELGPAFSGANAFGFFFDPTGPSALTRFTFEVHGNSGGGKYSVPYSATYALGKWYRVVGSWDGTLSSAQAKLYTSGLSDTVGYILDQQITDTMGNGVLNVGARNAGASVFAKVYMRNLVFDTGKIWTPEEVAAEFATGVLPLIGSGTRVINAQGNEESGATWADQSGNNNNITLGGSYTRLKVSRYPRRIPTTGNLVRNGDFSVVPPFVAATTTANRFVEGTAAGSTTINQFGWYLGKSGSGSANFDSSVVDVGSAYSMKLSTNATASYAEVQSGGASASAGIAVVPGASYTVTYRMKTVYTSGDSNDGANCAAVTYTGNGSAIQTYQGTKVKTTVDWTTYSFTFTAESNARWVLVRPRNYGHTGTATLILDAWYCQVSMVPVFQEQRTPVYGNLVKNGDFEVTPGAVATTTQNRWPDGTAGGSTTNTTYKWKQQSGANATAVSFDPTVSRNVGGNSLKISATDVTGSTYVDIGAGIASSQPVATLQSFAIPIVAGASYTLTGWVKTSNVPTNGAFLQLTTYNGAGTRIDNVGSSVKLTGTQDWTQITITQTVGATAVWATIGLMKNVAGNISDAWFEDIVFMATTPVVRSAA